MYIDALVKALYAGQEVSARAAEILVMAKDGGEAQALRRLSQLRREGHTAELCLLDREEDAVRYARDRGIARLDIVEQSVRTIDIIADGGSDETD